MEKRGSNEEPLLLKREEEEDDDEVKQLPFTASSFIAEGDIDRIRGLGDFTRAFLVESKKLWFLAGPAIFTSLCQYSLGAITQTFAGHVGTLQLAAVAVENSVIAGFSFGVMLGMGSALETLCGQAFGAGQLDMLGVYMQRSWVILNTTALILTILYIFATPLLKLIGQADSIAEAAGTFAVWMIPQLYAYAMNFPIAKFLQSQSKMMVMAAISAVALVLHTLFSWLLMLKLGWGLVGAAVVLNASWWFIVVAQLVYIFNGTCGRAWSGFSWKAFQNLWGFVRLSLASAVMLWISYFPKILQLVISYGSNSSVFWAFLQTSNQELVKINAEDNNMWIFNLVPDLEVWYFMALILFAGYLKNPELSVDALALCMNILGWAVMVAMGANAATRYSRIHLLIVVTPWGTWPRMVGYIFSNLGLHSIPSASCLLPSFESFFFYQMGRFGRWVQFDPLGSVRVSNELGAGHPRTAKFSVVVVVVTSFLIGAILSVILLITRKEYPSLFTSSEEVEKLVYELTPLLATSITINNVQPVLSGVAIGAGWQAVVAYVNIACYYVFGIPVGLILGYKVNLGVKGIWSGMLLGTVLQTMVLFWMTYRTNWNAEASKAEDRIRKWGGEPTDEVSANDVEK